MNRNLFKPLLTVRKTLRDRPQALRAAAFAILLLASTVQISDAAAARHRAPARGGGGGGGGGRVMLSTPTPSNPLEHNNRGVELGSKGLWPDAVHEHEEALNGDPFNQTFRMNLSGCLLRYGKVLMSKGNTYEAAKKLRYALYVDPNNMEADDVLANCIRSSHKDPDNPQVRAQLGDQFDTSGDYVSAIAEYRKYARMTDSGPAHFALGRVLMKQGNAVPAKLVDGYGEMKVALTKSWDANQKNDQSQCHSNLGEVLKDLAFKARDDGRTQTALKRLMNAGIEYRRAVTLNPSNGEALRGLIEVAREAVAVNPSFDNRLTLGGAYQLAGDFEHARREYEQCWKLQRDNPSLAQARRSYHMAVVQSPMASPIIVAGTVQKIEDQLRQTPNDPELLYIYGRGKEDMGDKDTALRAYQAAAAINPLINPDLQKGIQRMTGGGQAAVAATPGGAGRPAGATGAGAAQPGAAPGLLSTSAPASLPPEKPSNTAAYNQIVSKMQSGDVDGAQKDAQTLLEKDAKDAKAWLLLGKTHEKKGDLDQAQVAYRQASYLNDPEAKTALEQVQAARIKPILEEVDKQLAAKNLVGASSALRDALQIAPTPQLHRRLAEILKQMGDTKEMQKELDRADKLEKEGK